LKNHETCTANFPYAKIQGCPFFFQLNGGFARMDRRGCIRQCNPAFAQIFDVPSVEAMIGRCLLRYLPIDRHIEFTSSSWRDSLRTTSMLETKIETQLGNEKWLQIWLAPRIDDDGRLSGVLVVTLDITDKKQLELHNEIFRTAAEAVSEAVVITDLHGTIEFVNKSFETITGYDREDVIGESPSLLKSGQHSRDFYSNLWNEITSGNIWQGRFTNRRKDGTLYYEQGTIAPIHNDKGEVIKFVAVKRDVTDEILSEEQVRQTEKMKAIGVLAAGVAHDFNNILTSIIGYTSILLERNRNPEDSNKQLLESVLKESERAAKLCSQLLTFSRSDSNEATAIDLARFVENEVEILKRLLGENIELEIHTPPDEVIVRITPGKLYQVLSNLILNARDALTDHGRIELWVDSTENRAIFGCSDNGSGIPPEIADRVFEPFFTTKDVGEGTGLGLSLCYNIVTEAGGIITIDSVPNTGTTFVVELPLVKEAMAAPKALLTTEPMQS